MSKFKVGDRVVLVNIKSPYGGEYSIWENKANTIGNVGVVRRAANEAGWIKVLWDGVDYTNSYQECNLACLYVENV